MSDRKFEQKVPPAWKGRKYKLVRRENYSELLKELGFNVIQRKLAVSIMNVTVQLIKEGDEYIWSVKKFLGSTDLRFKDGIEFDETLPLGRKVKAVLKFKGDNRLDHVWYMEKSTVVVENDFTDTELVQVSQRNKIVSFCSVLSLFPSCKKSQALSHSVIN